VRGGNPELRELQPAPTDFSSPFSCRSLKYFVSWVRKWALLGGGVRLLRHIGSRKGTACDDLSWHS
jgi:hypothetical protein